MPAPTHGLPASEGSRRAVRRMRRALEVAAGTPAGDVPVGAVLFDAAGRELSTGVNRREQRQDPTAHAEVEAIRCASARRGDWRLEDCTIFVTLEPCPMCAGAILNARSGTVVYGAREEKSGSQGSVVDLFSENYGFRPRVYGGVCRERCAALMRTFFEMLRG